MNSQEKKFHRVDIAYSKNDLIEQLGDLPIVVRYYDDYTENAYTVQTSDLIWIINANGSKTRIDFTLIDSDLVIIIKHWAGYLLRKSPITAAIYVRNFISTYDCQRILIVTACLDPKSTIAYLRTDFFSDMRMAENRDYFAASKSILNYFCSMQVGGWDSSFTNILKSIHSPSRFSRHRSVRDGSAIISFEEERMIVEHFDELNAQLRRIEPASVPWETLRDACILCWIYTHAVRPIQIANRDIDHVRVRAAEDGQPIVHLTFRAAKQRGSGKSTEQTRKMKRDWTPMMAEWLEQRKKLDPVTKFDRPRSLFGLPPNGITEVVANITERLTGIRRTPYSLRHSAAQRKADAGCARIELAEFLMHKDIDTAEAYIEMSPTQAEKINHALGLSPLFQAIDQSIKARSVTLDQLRVLPDDMQVGAAPHGHAIVGIGGCSIGQSFCTKTPALACYGCSKFMYLRDAEVHRASRVSVEDIVHEFIDAGRSDRVSPAYMQLREVLETIDAIIEELDPAEERDQ